MTISVYDSGGFVGYSENYPVVPIVSSGLILNLDAGDTLSYPGSGTTWYDLSRTSAAVTLQSAVTFNSLGYLTFDGTLNSYIDFTATGVSTTTTVEMLVRMKSFANVMAFGWLLYDVCGLTSGFGYNTANSDVYGIPIATTTSLGLLNNWRHYIFEMRSDVSYTNNKIYINAAPQALSQVASSEFAANRGFNSGAGRIAGWRNTTEYRMPMDLNIFRVYNRALTQAEILQNYNSIRSRFSRFS